MGANVNICFRILIVNQIIFLLLMHINIPDCSTSPYGCTKGEGLLQGLAYILVFFVNNPIRMPAVIRSSIDSFRQINP